MVFPLAPSVSTKLAPPWPWLKVEGAKCRLMTPHRGLSPHPPPPPPLFSLCPSMRRPLAYGDFSSPKGERGFELFGAG